MLCRHVASTVIKVLETVANNISSETEMNDLLIKLLELFCKIGVRMKENMEKITKNTQKVQILFLLLFTSKHIYKK